MRQPLVVANWKMNGTSASVDELTKAVVAVLGRVSTPSIVLCPAYVHVQRVASQLSDTAIGCGAQDVSLHEKGAYTGEVSAAMLADIGCSMVIVGHSERRLYGSETDHQVAEKTMAAIAAGLTPVVCVGETLVEREEGQTLEVINRQLSQVLASTPNQHLPRLVVAYEPVWAIGTGKTATPEQAQEVHQHIRAQVAARNPAVALTIQLLYGGSVNQDNAASLFAQPDIDGGLIGGASLKARDFIAICHAAGR